MARFTRSTAQKQMDLIDQDDAAADIVLHVTPSTGTPSGTMREVLGEITANTEDNTVLVSAKNPVDVELKGLKAAFRSAIGIKKKKKPRKPKNLEASSTDETLDNPGTGLAPHTMAPGLIENTYLQHYCDQDATMLNGNNAQHAAPLPDNVRMTRQQLAKQQSGQFEQDVSFQDGSGLYPEAYHNPRSFSAQLISNLTDSQFEIYRTLEMANHSINLADGVRREIEGIINIPRVKAHLLKQPQIEVDSMLAERDVKMLSPVDDKAPTSTFRVPTKPPEVQNSPDKAVVSDDDDSFAQVITSRSPAKPVSRVDFVDELDKIEDVMDALDEATSPNIKPTSPAKIAFLSGTRGSVHGGEHLSRIFSPTDAELAKLRMIGNASTQDASAFGNDEKAAVTKDDCHRSLRVKSKDGFLQPNSTLRKVKSMHFESRMVSQSSQDLSGPSSIAVESKRPVTAPTAQSSQYTSRSSSNATETRRPVVSKRPTSMLPPKKSTKPVTRPKFELPGEAVSRKLKEQREARRAQRESEDVESRASSVAPKIRSTKAPTKSTFELPGEAISRRKREAHEVRLKQQEDDEKKRREFKAKPSRCSFIVNGGVRETAASRARQSMHHPLSETLKDVDTTKQPDTLTISKRGSIISSGPNRRPAIGTHNSSTANLPAAPLSHRNLTPHASVVGTSTAAHSISIPKTTSMTGLSTQRTTSIRKTSNGQKGKEIYQRQEKAMADMQREKREKEEAAKRSRELAAERGRQASREWAEKQKAKAKKDVDMGQGFGPGGQMGLK